MHSLPAWRRAICSSHRSARRTATPRTSKDWPGVQCLGRSIRPTGVSMTASMPSGLCAEGAGPSSVACGAALSSNDSTEVPQQGRRLGRLGRGLDGVNFYKKCCSASAARQAVGGSRGAVVKPRNPQGHPQSRTVDGWFVHGGRDEHAGMKSAKLHCIKCRFSAVYRHSNGW